MKIDELGTYIRAILEEANKWKEIELVKFELNIEGQKITFIVGKNI